MLRYVRRLGHVQPRTSDRDLALNLSLVLHERADSQVVRNAVRAVRTHERAIRQIESIITEPASQTGEVDTSISQWLSATIGLSQQLPDALGTSAEHVTLIDALDSGNERVSLFRAPATIAIPDHTDRVVGVAALVLRPDRRASHLIVSGPFDWPEQQHEALRALERVIQAHAGQWTPPRALWDAPAETLLSDEVYLGSTDASRMS